MYKHFGHHLESIRLYILHKVPYLISTLEFDFRGLMEKVRMRIVRNYHKISGEDHKQNGFGSSDGNCNPILGHCRRGTALDCSQRSKQRVGMLHCLSRFLTLFFKLLKMSVVITNDTNLHPFSMQYYPNDVGANCCMLLPFVSRMLFIRIVTTKISNFINPKGSFLNPK